MNNTQPRSNFVLTQTLILVMTLTTGLAVASNYYIQPLLYIIQQKFSLSTSQASSLVTVAQVSYGLGLLFIVPLGDIFEKRKLITIMTFMSAAGLFLIAFSQNIYFLLLGIVLVGFISVVAQVLVPFAATLAPPEKRGRTVGKIMSGLLLGILLARTVAGLLAELGGWQTVYWVAGIAMSIMGVVLYKSLPVYHAQTKMSYPKLIMSVFALFKTEPLFVQRTILGMASFCMFSLLWTSLTFLLSNAPYHYNPAQIGLFGLLGAAGAFAATLAGRQADKGNTHKNTFIGLIILLSSWICLHFGASSIIAIIIGILILDFAAQGLHIINQSLIFKLQPEARNRLNAGYMSCYFLGGSIGSQVSAWAYEHFAWNGVVISGLVVALLAGSYYWACSQGKAKN